MTLIFSKKAYFINYFSLNRLIGKPEKNTLKIRATLTLIFRVIAF